MTDHKEDLLGKYQRELKFLEGDILLTAYYFLIVGWSREQIADISKNQVVTDEAARLLSEEERILEKLYIKYLPFQAERHIRRILDQEIANLRAQGESERFLGLLENHVLSDVMIPHED